VFGAYAGRVLPPGLYRSARPTRPVVVWASDGTVSELGDTA
jgi:hypothetical protein